MDMENMNFIAVDLGATSGRVILASFDGQGLEMKTVSRFPTPLLRISGRYYWNIYSIYGNILAGLEAVGRMGVKVSSIGIDTWGVDFVPVGSDGTFSGLPRSYRDPYTEGVPERFFERMSRAELYDRTGIQIMNLNTVFQMFAQNEAGDRAYRSADKFLFMPDALSYMLTGKMVCEYTILSTSALMNPRTKDFDDDILALCGVDRSRFPEIVFPGHVVGTLTDEIASATGLGRVPVVAVAGHDTASAVAAVPAESPDYVYLSSGTWSLMGIEAPAPVINEKMAGLNFTNEGGVDGTTRLLKNITGMWLLEQCLVQWRKEGRQYSYAECHEMAAAAPSSKEFIDPDDRLFAAPSDMPAAIRSYCAARGMHVPASDGEMIRLIYDSLAAKYAEVFANLKDVSGRTLDTLHIIGGGANNEVLDRLTAEACNVKVVAGPSEGTSLGNVIVQARAAGLFKDIQEGRDYLRRSIDIKVFNP